MNLYLCFCLNMNTVSIISHLLVLTSPQGQTGKTSVFKMRSRVARDMWSFPILKHSRHFHKHSVRPAAAGPALVFTVSAAEAGQITEHEGGGAEDSLGSQTEPLHGLLVWTHVRAQGYCRCTKGREGLFTFIQGTLVQPAVIVRRNRNVAWKPLNSDWACKYQFPWLRVDLRHDFWQRKQRLIIVIVMKSYHQYALAWRI